MNVFLTVTANGHFYWRNPAISEQFAVFCSLAGRKELVAAITNGKWRTRHVCF